MKHETAEDLTIKNSPVKPSGIKPTKKYMRTCIQCRENFYSKASFSAHAQEVHGKAVVKSVLEDGIKKNSGYQKAELDVPEEILVKPRKVKETKKDTVAKSRRGRRSKDETKAEPKAEEKPKRKRRTKAEIEAEGK